MKKIITLMILSAMIIPVVSLAAPTNPTKDRLGEIKQERENLKERIQIGKEEMKNDRASTTENIRGQKAEIKSEIEKRIGKKLDEKRTNVANRFEEAIKNLKTLILRIESKLAKVSIKNEVLTATRASLEIAKTNITLAENELKILENKLAEPISTSTKKAYIANIKVQSEKTKEAIKTAHKSIVDTIESLKPGLLKDKSEIKATTTPINN